ncbi:uncharacterized protein LOC108909856 [Anoplophora glabripennis]|uniref:uncharacterized protein LOC108909856 n=1 Tax=Anoplophora glabripennis TaxID=217634 RepID=UPI00087414CE|nr:uncharacterized protein LOC108909856 [Anoplophora glabripennis]
MILPVMTLTIMFTVFIDEKVGAAIFSENRMFNEQESNCCIVPNCNRYGECYGIVKCGYVCSQGSYKLIDYGFTPGFTLKEEYTKNDCHFGLCQNYIFSCKHCPDPREGDFNIYTVRTDCRDCYYRDS